jgi:hypothetical protein
MEPMTDEERAEPRKDDDIGSEGEGSKDTPPPLPAEDDDTPLGDTDQHSDAQA